MAYDDLTHKKEQREARRAAGLCVKCGKSPPRQGRRTCAGCGVRSVEATSAWRERNPEAVRSYGARLSRYRKVWRKRRRDAGKCIDCGGTPRSGAVRCEACGEKRRAAGAKFRAADRERQRWYMIKHKYGLTRKEWDAVFATQGNRCAICLTDDHGGRGWHTDHNHKTGEVRGILCEPCNKGIGLFRDSPVALQRAARYVVVRGGNTTEHQAPLLNTEGV